MRLDDADSLIQCEVVADKEVRGLYHLSKTEGLKIAYFYPKGFEPPDLRAMGHNVHDLLFTPCNCKRLQVEATK